MHAQPKLEISYRRGEFRDDLPQPFIKRGIGHLFTPAADIAALDSADAFEDEMNHLIAFIRSGLAKP
jgi:hypothetical protein